MSSSNPVWFDFPADRVIEQMEFIHPTLDMIHRISVVDASADILFRMLAHNTLNRAQKRTEIARMTNDLKNGEWDFNGNAFVFASTGRMLDGQNRAVAIVNSGAEHVLILVVEGVPESAGDSIDQGVRRRPGDILALKGIKPTNQTVVISMANILMQASVPGGRFYSAQQIADYAETNLDQLQLVAAWAKTMSVASPLVQSRIRGKNGSRSLVPGALGALTIHVLGNGGSAVLWEKFIKAVATGLATDEHTLAAASAMRKRIVNVPLSGSNSGNPFGAVLHEFGTFIHTYNRWVRGETIQVVKDYSKTSPATLADLPKPVGLSSVNGDQVGLAEMVAHPFTEVPEVKGVPEMSQDAIHQAIFSEVPASGQTH